ncbi:MAG: hypothetical protein HRU70_15315 [Phycisphaeraceae bacterium]|nr:MAG: hypothetical protein HRU70_15315 [Phycisphaeraceae bacterium]
MRRAVCGVVGIAVAVSAGCAGGGGGRGVAVKVEPADAERRSALLGSVADLAGDWYTKDEQGVEFLALQFRVSSGGHVVREIMFPGSAHEMTNVYHMDGKDLVVTHYCAIGNQPRMRSTPGSGGDRIDFRFDSITNLNAAQDHYMGEMTLVRKGPDTLEQHWASFRDGAKVEGPMFVARRRGT